MNRKSHVMDHEMTLQIFGALKSSAFGGTSKKCSINSTPQVELKKKEGHVKSHVRCRGSCLPKFKGEKRQKVSIKTFQESNIGVD